MWSGFEGESLLIYESLFPSSSKHLQSNEIICVKTQDSLLDASEYVCFTSVVIKKQVKTSNGNETASIIIFQTLFFP